MRSFSRTGAICALGAVLLASQPSVSDDVPQRVRYELDNYRDMCVKAGGKPGALEAAIVRHDVDGDGVVDWILDSRKLPCPGASASYGEGTLLAIFLRYQDSWNRALLQSVMGWEVGFARGLPSLKLKQPGDRCHPKRKAPCWETYVFERAGSMRHIRTQ
jgi:hypothetical protein